MGILTDLSKFVDSVGNQVTTTFKNISDFLDNVLTFFVGLGFWIAVIGFFLVLILLLYGPVYIMRYWVKLRDEYKNFFKKFDKKIDD